MFPRFTIQLIFIIILCFNFSLFATVSPSTPTTIAQADQVLNPIDNDGDGYSSDVDCNDNDSSVNPGADEYPNNEVDENCDGIILFIDDDMDGYHSAVDCDDTNPTIHVNAIDIPNNGIDENCDGVDAQCNTADCAPNAGSISTNNGATSIFVCSGDNISDLYSFFTTSTATNFVYLIIDEQNIVLGILHHTINFEGSPPEKCRVIGVSYIGNLLIKVGDNITTTTLADGLADVSENIISITIVNASSCSKEPEKEEEMEIEDQRIKLNESLEQNVPKKQPQPISSNKKGE